MELHVPEINMNKSVQVRKNFASVPYNPLKGSIFCYWECQELELISTGKTFSYMSFLGWQKWEWHRYLCVLTSVLWSTYGLFSKLMS